jgi:hypothetical protein
MNTDAFNTLRAYLKLNPDKYIEIYTLSGLMHYHKKGGWFREGSETRMTLEEVETYLDDYSIKSIELSNGKYIWSLPGSIERNEYINGITKLPYVDNRSNDDCPICLNELDKGVCKLRCGHLFHCRCIKSWAKSSSYGKISCPLCREVSYDIINVKYTSFGKKKQNIYSEIRYLRSL